MSWDVIIVGAGPAGTATAARLASLGKKVLVLEEHSEIGRPIQCAGLVSWRIKELVPDLPEDVIINQILYSDFYFSEKHTITLTTKKPFYVLDRAKFDKFLGEKAQKAGAEIKFNTKFLDFDGETIKTNNGEFKTKMLIGADGPCSRVAEVAKIERPSVLPLGIQATIEGEFKPDTVEVWYGRKVAPNFYAWVIPESATKARIGMAAIKDARKYFDNFCKIRLGRTVAPDVAGLIRGGLQKQTVKGNIQLIGDAATMVKPLSGGGVTFSLIAAKYCGDPDYEQKWRKELEGPILRGLRLRRLLYNTPEFMRPFFVKKYQRKLQKLDADFIEEV